MRAILVATVLLCPGCGVGPADPGQYREAVHGDGGAGPRDFAVVCEPEWLPYTEQTGKECKGLDHDGGFFWGPEQCVPPGRVGPKCCPGLRCASPERAPSAGGRCFWRCVAAE